MDITLGFKKLREGTTINAHINFNRRAIRAEPPRLRRKLGESDMAETVQRVQEYMYKGIVENPHWR